MVGLLLREDAGMDPKQQFRRRMEWLEAVAGDSRLSGVEARAAILIAVKYVNSKTGRAYPGYANLAKELNVSPRWAIMCMKGLCRAGWLALNQSGGGRGKANEYVLTQPKEGGKVIPFQLKNSEPKTLNSELRVHSKTGKQ
jgi:hypothetical protein